MKAGRLYAAGLLLVAAFALSISSKSAVPAESCADDGRLSFVCDANQPEDLAWLPGTQWMFVSGFSASSGLKLLDMRQRQLQRWDGRTNDTALPDLQHFPACPGEPDAAALNLQGLSLRRVADGEYRLLASNHGGREAIEVFRVSTDTGSPDARPRVRWIGCLPLPAGMAANSVTSFPDGTVLATVLTLPGRTMADYVLGRNSGVVLEWTPGAKAFRKIPGTELPGNNGIEADPDNQHFYVVAFGRHSIVGFLRGRTARKVFETTAPGFMPDNIHWDGARLVAAGMQFDEPACGGLRKVIDGVAEPMTCHRGFTVAHLDQHSLAWRVLAYDLPNASFNGVSTGLPVGNTLWLGSFQSDRMASLALEARSPR